MPQPIVGFRRGGSTLASHAIQIQPSRDSAEVAVFLAGVELFAEPMTHADVIALYSSRGFGQRSEASLTEHGSTPALAVRWNVGENSRMAPTYQRTDIQLSHVMQMEDASRHLPKLGYAWQPIAQAGVALLEREERRGRKTPRVAVAVDYVAAILRCANELATARLVTEAWPLIFRNDPVTPQTPALDVVCRGHRAYALTAFGEFTDCLSKPTSAVNLGQLVALACGTRRPYGARELAALLPACRELANPR